MNGVNLVPIRRQQARQRGARIRMWMVIAPVVASVLTGVYGWLRASWATGSSNIAAEITKLDALSLSTETEITALRLRIAELKPRLLAARAVGNQPDWGVLLALLATKLRDDAILSSCTLTPVAPEAQPAPPGGKPAGDWGRPERFTLSLAGFARTQESFGTFVSALEGAGLFERVRIAESKRGSVAGTDAVSFRVECLLSDPITEAP